MKTPRSRPRKHRGSAARRSSGFTLIELALAIFIIALILGSILVPLSTQVDRRQAADAQHQLEQVREALIGHALTLGYLPCPDTDNDGLENVSAGVCTDVEGVAPWATLGVPPTDPWGNRVRYRVSAAFAQRTPAASMTLNSQGALLVCLATGCAVGERITELPPSLNAAAAALVSHGPNGWGGIIAVSGAVRLPPGCTAVATCADISADEKQNADGNDYFVSRERSAAGSAAGEFDDIVLWLSPHVLKQRMVAAGRLP